jgi:hypothetical protein
MTDRHAYYVGWVRGVAARHGLRFDAVLDGDGNYTDQLVLHLDATTTFTVIVPPPPDDWSPSYR